MNGIQLVQNIFVGVFSHLIEQLFMLCKWSRS